MNDSRFCCIEVPITSLKGIRRNLVGRQLCPSLCQRKVDIELQVCSCTTTIILLASSGPLNPKAPAHLLALTQGLAGFACFFFFPLCNSGSCPDDVFNKA